MDGKIKELVALGREHYRKADYERAENYLAQVYAERKDLPDVLNMLGVIFHESGRFTEAKEVFEKALESNPRYTEAALNLAITYNDLGNYDAAKEVYNQALRASSPAPDQADSFALGKIANLHAEVAHAYSDVGMIDQAIEQMQKAVLLRPTFVDLRMRLARFYRQIGNLDQARAELEKAISMQSSYLQARVALGVVLLAQGLDKEAASQWNTVLEYDSENKTAKAFLKLLERRSQMPPAC
ncbi:MAG: tetratricopeptide repeat protein [Myxococcales bacterium]|nr:MAG: tetratricopeptide repeat protein [Myxococcales bacterium]